MSRHVACLLVVAGLALGCAQHASATILPVQNEKEAIKQFKGITKEELKQMKDFLKSELSALKSALKGHASSLKSGADPFTVAANVADDIASALSSVSLSLLTHAGNVDADGSTVIQDLDSATSGAENFFPGVRHGDGGDLDKFVASVNKELIKFMSTIRKELAKLRKAFIKNDGSISGFSFIFTVHEFPRSFDPSPSNGSSTLNGENLNAWLLGFALILPGTPDRQDIYVIAICRAAQIDVDFRRGSSVVTPLTSHSNVNPVANGIFLDSTSETTTDPIFADGFESGDTSAWSNTVP